MVYPSQGPQVSLERLEETLERALRWFEGPGRVSQARVDQWGPQEVLAHLLYWHHVTTEGVESVASGGPPAHPAASADELNAQAVDRERGRDIGELCRELRRAQERLWKAVLALHSLDAPVRIQPDGTVCTTPAQLGVLVRHLTEHLQELEESAKG